MVKIDGSRIVLRDHIESDFEFYFSWVSNSSVMKFLDWRIDCYEDARKSFDKAIAENYSENRTKFFFAVLEKDNDKLIGECGFTVIEREAELGYFFKPEYWGKGYATEATKLMINFCLKDLKLSKVSAECSIENIASEKVMINSGMKFVKHFETKSRDNTLIKKALYETTNIG
jgi:RimJ/RimL family protein N-acetyltransferase